MTYEKDLTTTYTVGDQQYTVTAPALFDSETDELVPNQEVDDRVVRQVEQMHRDRMGLVGPDELQEYRAKVGLTREEFAELTGIHPQSILFYEAGAFPDEKDNQILKSFLTDDQAIRDFLGSPKAQKSPELSAKLEGYLQGDAHQVTVAKHQEPKFTAVQLANWFRVENYYSRQLDENIDPLTQMKVIKLLYFAYGRYLVKTRNRLFTSPIIHLQYGPVVTEVHQQFAGKATLDPEKPETTAMHDFNEVSTDPEILQLLQEVNDQYVDYSAFGLSQKTHQVGSPWQQTPQGEEIKDQLIFDAFNSGREE